MKPPTKISDVPLGHDPLAVEHPVEFSPREQLPPRMRDRTWGNFETPPGLPLEFSSRLDRLRKWRGDKQSDTVAFVTGPPGTGKTHLAAATANRWMAVRGWGCRFLVIGEWLQAIKDGFNIKDGTASRVIDQAKNCKLLIFDDLGSEMATEWVRDTVYVVINHRYNELMPILVTSNLSLSDISQNYHDRLASRLASGLVVNTAAMPDRRISTAATGANGEEHHGQS